MFAFFGAAIPLASLALLGVKWALKVLVLASCAYAAIQTITFSLFLYGAELYPTHIRALCVGMGSAFLRIGSSLSPILVGAIAAGRRSLSWVFVSFCVIAIASGVICSMFAVETKGRVLEDLSDEGRRSLRCSTSPSMRLTRPRAPRSATTPDRGHG
jgi:putative MFS transporter